MDTLTLARSFTSLLLDTAAKGTALLLLACLAAWLCRRSSAALRHSIWCMTMGGLLVLPVASWALPAWQIPILPPEPLPAPVAEVARLPAPPVAEVVRLPAFTPQDATGESFDSPVPRQSTTGPTVLRQSTVKDTGGPERPPVTPSAPPVIEPVAEPLTAIEWTSLLVSAGWLLGVSLFSVLLLVGLWRTVKLRRTSLTVADGEWPGMLVELRQRLGLSRAVELREHAESVVPLTWGIWRPVVLLPKLARAWDEPMRRAVLLHELAHVQRGDVACQVLGRLTCVLYWFHPLAWFALRQLRQEREQACDDAVVGTGEKASDYAEQLLQVARLCCAPRGLSLGVAMAEGSSLERRVKSLFDSARSHGPLTRRVAIASFLLGGAILAGLAPIEPTASQAEPPVVEAVQKENVVADPPMEIQERILEGDAARRQMNLLKPVFGEAKRGIQLGLAVGSLQRTFPQGGRIPLWLFYRNLGDKELTFHLSQDFMNDPPTVTDANGNRVQVSFVLHWMFIAPLKITLQPGEVWCIATPGLYLGDRMPSIKPVAGKYKLTYPQGIWDVNTTPRLNTDLPFLPTGTPDISGLLKADPKQPASNALVGQMVETPNWSEHLTTGGIEFEIAPGKNGQLEARVLAAEKHASDADTEAQTGKQTPTQPAVAQPKVIELLSRFRESRQRLEPLHVQMRHIEEYTDAFRAHHRIQAERQELVVKAIQKMSTEDFKKANPHLGPGISADYVRLSIKDSYDTNRSFAKMQNQSVSDVELFQKGTAYQIRTRHHSNDQALGSLTFPAEPLTAGNLGTTYKEIGFYSWAPQTSPSGMIVYGSQPEYRQITSKPYHTNGANPIPAFSNFVSTRSHDWHPIDAFFFQPPENYRVIGAETIDGRETVIVEVPVATSYSQGFANEKGESYQLKEVHYHRAWLDPARGSLPVKLLIWHGNEKTDFATHVSQPPRNVMTTQQLTEVVPGGWYPTLTTLDKYDRDEEKMPKAPPSGQGTEWDQYLEDVAKVPFVVYERETWKCELVEVPRTLTDEFFVLPTPAGAKIIDRDREDLIDDYSLGLPVNEFSEVGVFLGKAWLLGPLSVMPDLTKDEGVGEVTQTAPKPVGQNEDTPKADTDVELDKGVWWGEAVDGLEPGFWLTKSEDPRNLRIPMDSLVNYRVVVRNTTTREVEFLVRLLPFDGVDVPYLIPSDKLDSKGRITPPQPAKEFQAQGAAKELSGLNAVQAITLDAGESVLLPECGLYLGKAPDERYPQIADFVPGTHWIVQPLLVHPLTFKERGKFDRAGGRDTVTKIARDGKTRQEGVVYATGSWDQELKPAYAKYHLEVGTLNAEAHRNAEKATWGEVEQGMQCGIRLLNPQPSYKIGDTLEAEVLWRNTTAAVISTSRPRQLDLYPIIQDAEGNAKLIDFGARFDLLPGDYDYQPGEVVSLGISKITLVAEGAPSPKSNMEPGQITLEPGKYQLIGNGGVGNINPRSGKVEFVVEPADQKAAPAPEAPRQIRGQIIDEEKLGVPNAEVLIVGGTDWNRPLEGQLIAQGVTNEKGEFAIPIPESELAKNPWGQVWRRAPGYAAARGNSVQSLESLMEEPLTYGPLVRTEGLHLVVHDPSGKPRAGVRAEALYVRVSQGVGYALPAAWRDDNSGVSDAEGRVHLPYIDPGSLERLELTPDGHSAGTQYGPNYFLNYRPQEASPHFVFATVESGVIEGQLVPAPGVTLPKGLKIPLKTLTGKINVMGVREVTVDDAGRFRVPDMPVGEISVLKFLDDAQPLRPWISERAFVKAGETTKLEIPIVTGTRVTGRVQKSDTKAGVADYEFEVYYGPAIKFRGSDLWLMTQPVKADAEGRFELFLPPGPINLRLTRNVDGYRDATSWLPREKRGGLGPLHEIPSEAEFELPVIDLVKMLPVQGTLVDQNDKPLSDGFSWNVVGYPEIPGEEEGFVMNSMAGVHTDKEGRFEGSYPEPYPPVRWKASHRVWKTKYEFDDIKYRAEVVQKSPLILQVDTTKPLED